MLRNVNSMVRKKLLILMMSILIIYKYQINMLGKNNSMYLVSYVNHSNDEGLPPEQTPCLT